MISPTRMMEIAKEYFPDQTDLFVGDILWNHTGAPCFLSEPIEANLRQQLACVADAIKHKYPICDMCNSPIQPETYMCSSCERALLSADNSGERQHETG